MNRQESEKLRQEFVREIKTRLIGPTAIDEELPEKPNKRYLTGMLFPKGASAGHYMSEEQDLTDDMSADNDREEFESPMDMLFQKLPASVGMTFALADGEKRIRVDVAGARYIHTSAEVIATELDNTTNRVAGHKVWKRMPLAQNDECLTLEFGCDEGRQKREIFEGLASVHVYVRKAHNVSIATVSVVNERETPQDTGVEVEDVIFQLRMECRPDQSIPAYPDPPVISEDSEAEEMALQYRSHPTFAVGHGCGVEWPEPQGGVVRSVSVDYMPAVEVPPVTTDIGSLPKTVKEALSLVRLQDSQYDPLPAFESLATAYESWRNRLESETVLPRFDIPKASVIARIDEAVRRIREGAKLLGTDAKAMHIFRMANRAMLLSIARSNANRQRPLGAVFKDVSIDALAPDNIRWRPFQLAFFLLSLQGLWNSDHADRNIVDLIWFPTGGGKTEAYLAVAAFEMLRRRLIDGDRGNGTAIIKRYTLRLLTIQQFERAGGLVCSLETMRRKGEIDCNEPFSLGLWVGRDSSPNDFADAIADLKRIMAAIGKVEGVRVPLKQCPVCATPIVKSPKDEGGAGVGLREVPGAVEVFCPNDDCVFHDSLPISYIDEYLYDRAPTMLLGTIDKFAMLAWRNEARTFFGNDRNIDPPSLIIQDELHLISGPLGTMAGIYEAAIDTVIMQLGRPAKYICATATIRRAGNQIRKLYGREAALFPPPGLDAADSFFSRVMKEVPGRLYIGSMGQGHTPTFSNVIASTALLAAGGEMREHIGNLADTWWTLVAYHNSKRELGKTLSLARDDIPARLKALGEKRRVSGSGVKELSANLRDSEVPEALHQLAQEIPSTTALDFVACTNMLSVGVDVQRLGLMMVNGQPKTVSEYIQATSRVGRDNRRLPGIVFALFSPSKPRDRSHYEFFRSFHNGYYRHVEPTSVTPYALPAQDRGLHGAFLALVRMTSSLHELAHASKILQKEAEVRALAEAFLERVEAAMDGDIVEIRACLDCFIDWWIERANEKGANLKFHSVGRQHASLIRPFRKAGEGRETLQSLRNVDTPLKLIVPLV
jgi:hypothetical protein